MENVHGILEQAVNAYLLDTPSNRVYNADRQQLKCTIILRLSKANKVLIDSIRT